MPIILRRPPSSFTRPIPDRDRNWGEHFPAYRADGRFALQAMCLPLGFALLCQVLVQNWEIAAVLMAHNHPSGETRPNRADKVLTSTLKTALSLVDVRVLDHIITAGGASCSMAELGLM